MTDNKAGQIISTQMWCVLGKHPFERTMYKDHVLRASARSRGVNPNVAYHCGSRDCRDRGHGTIDDVPEAFR